MEAKERVKIIESASSLFSDQVRENEYMQSITIRQENYPAIGY